MTKCSGYLCVHREKCLHYVESLKRNFVKGKWIKSEKCINPIWDFKEEVLLKPEYSELLLKES